MNKQHLFKALIGTIGFTAAMTQPLSATTATEELLWNPGFENWQNSILGSTPEDWETALGESSQETTLVLSGEYALRLTSQSSQLGGKLQQEVRPALPETFIPGDQYELTIQYYTVTSNGGNDICLNSYWSQGGTPMEHDKELLDNGTFFSSPQAWGKQTIQTTVPEGATSFYLSLKVSEGSTVVFDDFSFKKVASTEPTLQVQPSSIPELKTQINTPVQSGDILVRTENLPGPVNIEITGADRDMFSVSANQIAEGETETILQITYQPTKAGSHSAVLTFDCPAAPEVFTSIQLNGKATDPANPPVITVNTPSPVTFHAPAGGTDTQTISVSSRNISEYLWAKVTDTNVGVFHLSTTLLPENQENVELEVTFAPKESGTFHQRIEFYSENAQSVFIDLTGIATEAGGEEETEGDRLPLDPSNPVSLLDEHFDEASHNLPLSIKGWKNIAVEGKRAWWGYDFTGDNEKTAKVTAYDSQAIGTYPTEMWLVTPPLDFLNAQSKIFTFRVMGDLLLEGQDASLEVYYMDMADGTLFRSPVEGIAIPSIPDENGEWREFHINLEGQNIADVFFMAFCFTATGGRENSAVYYIDDVSFGRTDLPTLTPSITVLAEEVMLGETYTSPDITITARNLTEPIALTLGGANPSAFELSTEGLPATGGSFNVTFSSEQEGVHEAYVKIASRGAADVYIPLVFNNQKGSAIEIIAAEGDKRVAVYDYSGKLVQEWIETCNETWHLPHLPKGIYILQETNAKGSTARKIFITQE